MRDTVVLATIFPANLRYFSEFLQSIDKQTDQEFDLIIANDGVGTLNLSNRSNCEILPVTGTPFEIRITLMRYASAKGYSRFVFADTDDLLSFNRVEALKRKLKHNPVVCNDIDIMNAEGKITIPSYWAERIPNNTLIDPVFLRNKNVVGFGNVALTAEAFSAMTAVVPVEVPAPDWYFFFLLSHHHKILFTDECSTHYRQHENNMIGASQISEDRLKFVIQAKQSQYKALAAVGFNCVNEQDQINLMAQKFLTSTSALAEAVETLKKLNINYFWWEETTFLNG